MGNLEAPAHSAIRYKVSQDKYEEGPSPFSGVPRLELDEAWSKLLRCTLDVPTLIASTDVCVKPR